MRESRWMRSSTRRRKSNFVASERERERESEKERERESLRGSRSSAFPPRRRGSEPGNPRPPATSTSTSASAAAARYTRRRRRRPRRRDAHRFEGPRPVRGRSSDVTGATAPRRDSPTPSPLALSPRLTNKFPSTSPRTTFYVSFSLGKYLGVEWIIIRITKRIIIVRSKLRWNSVRASFIYFENISLDLR